MSSVTIEEVDRNLNGEIQHCGFPEIRNGGLTRSQNGDTVHLEKSKENEKKKIGKLFKDLTVKPIRILQEEPRHSLKKTIKFRLKPENLHPLETQVAGHGAEKTQGIHRGLLLHEAGYVLKPVQAAPKGEREVQFYQHISTSPQPVDTEFYSFIPKFHGIERIPGQALSHEQYLILENITQDFRRPCVMDIKIGGKTYGPDASAQKMTQEDSKYLGTKKPLGFSVLGIILPSLEDEGIRRWDKSYGMNLSSDGVGEILQIFLNHSTNPPKSKLIASCFLNLLEEVVDFFERQDVYHVFASSLLFVYDLDALETDTNQLENLVRLKMIDFAHVFPANGIKDENFLFGAQNLHKMFREFLNG